MPRVTLLTIGDELLRGDVVDTNAAWLCGRLFALGAEVERVISCGDALDAIAGALREAARAGAAVVTGGLGPTDDDRTADAACRVAGVERVLHEPSLARIRERFARAGRTMTPNNERQARVPAAAEVLDNPVGTAPGFALDLPGPAGPCRAFFLPGVPREMRRMFEDHVAAHLAGRPRSVGTLRVFGLTESQVDHALSDLRGSVLGGCTVHYRPVFPEILVTVVAPDAAALEAVTGAMRERLGSAVYGRDDDTLSAVVGAALRARGATLALAESCSGGLLGDLVTDTPGSSDYFRLGVVAYDNACKERVLGVGADTLARSGAVSRECAVAMAEGARRLADATFGVATTGIAGPGGGTADKPVGLVHVAVAGPEGEPAARELRFPGARDQVKRLGAFAALGLLLRRLQGKA